MKYINTYIFATIIALLLTSTLQAAPKAYDSLGNELEIQQKDCEQYMKEPKVSKKLIATCKTFNINVNKAFKVGYPLDASVESGTTDEKKAAHYLDLLLKADESRDNLIKVIKSDTIKARKSNNIKYFSFLIAYNKIVLSSKNYEFMKQHHEVFHDNPIYKQAITREAERKAEKKKAKEEEIAIAKEEATKKKQRPTKYLSPSSRVTNYRPSSFNDQDPVGKLLEAENRRLDRTLYGNDLERHMESLNQQAYRGINSNNIGQFRREQMKIRESYRQWEP